MSAKPVFELLVPPEEMEAFLAAIEEGIADGKAGRTVSIEAVRRWVYSLSTDQELPPPECP
jgi:predicted transcriptional regulator